VLFGKGHLTTASFQFYEEYSTNHEVRSFRQTFPVDSITGDEFTLAVNSSSDENITYQIDIEIVESDRGLVFAVSLIGGVILIAVIIWAVKKFN